MSQDFKVVRLVLATVLTFVGFAVLAFALLARPVPNVVGEPRAAALRDLRTAGFSVVERSRGDTVVSEAPLGSLVLPGTTVALDEAPSN